MPSRARIPLLVAAAFAVGVLSAPLLGLPGREVKWKSDGQLVRLTVRPRASGYLILSAGDSGSPLKTVTGGTVEVAAPATVYRLTSLLQCLPPLCNDCDDCPVPKPPRPQALHGTLVIPELPPP